MQLRVWGHKRVVFTMEDMKAGASSLHLACAQGAVLCLGKQVSHPETGLSSQDGLDSHVSVHFQFGRKSDGSF